MTKLSVSFILLTYNQQDTVCEAVGSILAQEGLTLEIVISDDCSADNTFELVKSTVKGYRGPHKIILNRNSQNLGIAGNLDKAHQLSSGKIIIVGAGDDISYPHRSQRILEVFKSSDPLLVCSFASIIDQNHNPISSQGEIHQALFYNNNWDLYQAALSNSLYIGATGAWKRSLYERYGPIEPIAFEDLIMGFRAALENRVSMIDEKLIEYRLGGESNLAMNNESYSQFLISQQKKYNMLQAVFTQRIKDAYHYGLNEKSTVMRILQMKKDRIDSKLNLYKGKKLFLYRHIWLRIKFLNSQRLRKRRSKKLKKLS